MVEKIGVNYADLAERQVNVPYNVVLDTEELEDFLVIPGIDELLISFDYTKAKMQAAMEFVNSSTGIDKAIWSFSGQSLISALRKQGSKLAETLKIRMNPVTVVNDSSGKVVTLSVDLGKLLFEVQNYFPRTEDEKTAVFADLIGSALTRGVAEIRFPKDRKARDEWEKITSPIVQSMVKVEPLQTL